MRMRLLSSLLVLSALGASALGAEFTLADLQRMVRELEAFAPKNPKYQYPIKCIIVDKLAINAYATAEFVKGSKDPRPQAIMAVFTGLIRETKGDKRILRAVVAHEISHLSNGHVYGKSPRAADLAQFWNRAQESEADRSGAILLQKAGYSKQDMIDMLAMLEATRGRRGSWFMRLTGSHPDPKARAAAIADDPTVMRSLLSFDVGLAYMDSRDFDLASAAFDKAAALEPRLKEAVVNSAQCRLMDYYDNLNGTLRRMWFRPDFGPVLRDPSVRVGKGSLITDEDRRRYAEAMDRLERARKALGGHERVNELYALAQVLHPDGDKDIVRKGVETLMGLSAKTTSEERRLRYANNAAVGLERLESVQQAYSLMLRAQQGSEIFNPSLAENVGRLQVTDRSKDLDQLAARMMFTWLSNTPSASPNWQTIHENYQNVCRALNVRPAQIPPVGVYLTSGMRLTVGNRTIALLMSVPDAIRALGQPDAQVRFDSQYPDVSEIKWQGGAISASTSDDQILRVSSSVPGSTVELKPLDPTLGLTLRIRVGMTLEEFDRVLEIDRGVVRELSNRGQPEEWLYYPQLSLGVRLQENRVVAVTLTPIREIEAP